MASNITVVPAVLATSEGEYQEKIKRIVQSHLFDDGWVQIDLMDNIFVQNKSVDSKTVQKYPLNLKIELHLMVEKPDNWLNELSGFSYSRVVVPVEIGQEAYQAAATLSKSLGKSFGFSINPETEFDSIMPHVNKVDSVLIMGVRPGFGGQEFIPETLDKIKQAARLRQENTLNFLIGVDGGVNVSNIRVLVEAGVDYVVIGEHLTNGDIAENLENIWQAIYS